MTPAYKALLRGNYLEWFEEAPKTDINHPLSVQVTVDEQNVYLNDSSRGPAMAALLEKLAQSGVFSEISDPVAWQREIRQDRSLPGRIE